MATNTGRFEGMTFLVAGAAGGIGSVIAERLHSEGANLALADLASIENPPSDDALLLSLDATDASSWKAAREATLDRFGSVHGLVHTVGILGRQSPIVDLDPKEWRLVMETNLTSAFLALAEFLPVFTEQRDGRIVLLASIAGKEGNAGQAAYSSAKGGLIALTKSAAKEVATDGVRVNCIAPTMIEGPLMQQMTQEQIDGLLAKIPMGRVGKPHEVAAMASWLLSDEASFSTGQCFDLSGGRASY